MIDKWAHDTTNGQSAKDRKAWAVNGLRALRGKTGFVKLIKFGIDTDYVCLCSKLVLVQDKSERDVSLHDWECERYLQTTKAMFEEGRLFEEDCQGTFTWCLLQCIRGEPDWFFPDQDHHERTWPKVPTEVILHARNLYDLTKAHMLNTFRHYCYRKCMRAFYCSASALPEAMRLSLFEELAAKEKCCKHDTRIQFLRS